MSPQHRIVPQTQDQLRERFVGQRLENYLRKYHCEITEPFDLALDADWQQVIQVKREEYKDWQTEERMALIYWNRDGEPLIIKLEHEGVFYRWNHTPATRDWASYNYRPEL